MLLSNVPSSKKKDRTSARFLGKIEINLEDLIKSRQRDGFVKSPSARHCEESAPGGRRGSLMKPMSYKGRDYFALLARTSFMTFYEVITIHRPKESGERLSPAPPFILGE
jgi:hypothetical protein